MNKVRLGDTCEILNGYAFKSENYVTEGIRVIRIANVQKGYIEDKEPQYYPINFEEDITKYFLYENDLLISLTGNVGRVALLPKEMLPAALNQRVACLRMKAKSVISKDYLFHYLNSDKFENDCITSSKGVAQKNMSTEWLKNYEIPVFSQVKQRHISILLSLIDSLIEKEKLQLQKSDELVKSRFVEMFSNGEYGSVKLKSVCSKITDGTHKTPNYLSEGITFISAKNIVNGELDFSDVRYISEKEYNEIQKRCQVKINDILLSKSGSLGSPVIIKTDMPIGLFESLAIIKYNRDKLLPEFLCEQLKSDNVQRQFMEGTKGVAVKHLHLNVIGSIEIIIPPLDLQQQFADFVAQTDKSKLVVNKQIDKLETLKKSLMQEYFG